MELMEISSGIYCADKSHQAQDIPWGEYKEGKESFGKMCFVCLTQVQITARGHWFYFFPHHFNLKQQEEK